MEKDIIVGFSNKEFEYLEDWIQRQIDNGSKQIRKMELALQSMEIDLEEKEGSCEIGEQPKGLVALLNDIMGGSSKSEVERLKKMISEYKEIFDKMTAINSKLQIGKLTHG